MMPLDSSRRWLVGMGAILLGVGLGHLALAADSPPVSAASSPLPSSEKPSAAADTLFQQGIRQFQANQHALAIQSWQQALKLYQQQHNQKKMALTLENLGLVYQTLGQAQRAIAFYQQQLELTRQLGDRMAQANALANLGSNYRILGNYTQALNYTQQSLEIRQALGDRLGEGKVLANLGNIQAELGKYETAIALHQKSLAIAQQIGNQQGAVISLNSIGALYGSLGQYDKAQQAYEQCLQVARAIHFVAAEGSTLNNLGAILHTQGHFTQAIDYYQQSLKIAQRLADLRMQGAALAGLGLGYTSLQQYPQAIADQEQSLAVIRKLGDRKLEGLTLSNLGYTLWRSGDLVRATQQYRAAIDVLESLRFNLDDPDLVSLIDTQMVSYNSLQQVLVALNQPEAALEIAERSRARAFVALLARRFGKGAQTTTPAPTLAPTTSGAALTIAEIRQIAKAHKATLVEYAIIPDQQFVAQGKLKGEDAHLFIWVVQPNGTVSFRQVDLSRLRQHKVSITSLVQRSRSCLSPIVKCQDLIPDVIPLPAASASPSESPPRPKNLALQQLHQLLIQPIADLLPTNSADRVIFIPQDALFLVPFPALQDPNGTYFVEQHTPLTVPSIQVLALTQQIKTQRQAITATLPASRSSPPLSQSRFSPALIVGNPVMPKVGQQKLAALPAAETEAKQIAVLFKTHALTGSAATEQAVLQRMTQAKLIHLATHGLLQYGQETGETGIPGAIALAPNTTSVAVANVSNPSAIALARGDTLLSKLENDSGILSANEIFDLRLQADLVVLSACDTGRGRITGDGVIGLSRSFISAGAPSVIVSLWAVSDASTAELMTHFYQNLLQQPDKAQALRQAMLSTMQNYPRPLDWAAFTLIGEAD